MHDPVVRLPPESTNLQSGSDEEQARPHGEPASVVTIQHQASASQLAATETILFDQVAERGIRETLRALPGAAGPGRDRRESWPEQRAPGALAGYRDSTLYGAYLRNPQAL